MYWVTHVISSSAGTDLFVLGLDTETYTKILTLLENVYVFCHVTLCHRRQVIQAKLWQLPLQKFLPNANQWTECDQNVQVKIVSPSKTTDDFARASLWLLCSPVTANYINKGSDVYIANTLCLKPWFAVFPVQQPKFSLHYEHNHKMNWASMLHPHRTLRTTYKKLSLIYILPLPYVLQLLPLFNCWSISGI